MAEAISLRPLIKPLILEDVSLGRGRGLVLYRNLPLGEEEEYDHRLFPFPLSESKQPGKGKVLLPLLHLILKVCLPACGCQPADPPTTAPVRPPTPPQPGGGVGEPPHLNPSELPNQPHSLILWVVTSTTDTNRPAVGVGAQGRRERERERHAGGREGTGGGMGCLWKMNHGGRHGGGVQKRNTSRSGMTQKRQEDTKTRKVSRDVLQPKRRKRRIVSVSPSLPELGRATRCLAAGPCHYRFFSFPFGSWSEPQVDCVGSEF